MSDTPTDHQRIAPDTAPPDHQRIAPDTAPPDTAPPDTAPPDTAPPDTAPPDTALRTTGPHTVIDRYVRLADRFGTVVDAVSDDERTARTPCSEWSVDDIVEHVVTTQRDFLERMDRPAPDLGDTPSTALSAVRDEMQRALVDEAFAHAPYDGYFGPTTFAETVDTFYSLDLMVHAWDIARAAGLDHLAALDVDDVRHVAAALEPAADAVRSPGIFGPPVEIDDDASEQDRFLAWTGRRP